MARCIDAQLEFREQGQFTHLDAAKGHREELFIQVNDVLNLLIIHDLHELVLHIREGHSVIVIGLRVRASDHLQSAVILRLRRLKVERTDLFRRPIVQIFVFRCVLIRRVAVALMRGFHCSSLAVGLFTRLEFFLPVGASNARLLDDGHGLLRARLLIDSCHHF